VWEEEVVTGRVVHDEENNLDNSYVVGTLPSSASTSASAAVQLVNEPETKDDDE